jgi:hypothetical protein
MLQVKVDDSEMTMKLEEMRKQLALVRGEAEGSKRCGISGRELNDLKWEAVVLSGEIERARQAT